MGSRLTKVGNEAASKTSGMTDGTKVGWLELGQLHTHQPNVIPVLSEDRGGLAVDCKQHNQPYQRYQGQEPQDDSDRDTIYLGGQQKHKNQPGDGKRHHTQTQDGPQFRRKNELGNQGDQVDQNQTRIPFWYLATLRTSSRLPLLTPTAGVYSIGD